MYYQRNMKASLCYFCVEEFIQCVQTTAGMAVVLMIRCVMGCGDEVAAVVS